MKARNEVLKQARICSNKTIEFLSTSMNLSVSYIMRLEAGEIQNLDYIYGKYAKALGIPVGCLKKVISNAEKEKWEAEQIAIEVKKAIESMRTKKEPAIY